jgi:light-regulated signal transduction histidine kinase (bacteriophytochrome)
MAREKMRMSGKRVQAVASPAKRSFPLETLARENCDANARLAVLNDSLQAARAAADAANRELESFSHLLAHDLRAPLRCIDGFGEALLEDYADKLGDEGREQLRFMREAAQEMAALIDGLLTLSRVTRSEMRRDPVDLAALARLVVAQLRNDEPDRFVETIIADDLVAPGDCGLLRLVLENLLGNAWKFTSKCALPRIEFGATAENGQRTYFVRDNGVGFDMVYADKLFEVFQRLHSPGEFEGTGIGLATVQRIVKRHGGCVWAESKVDRGATFHFTLWRSRAERP